MKDSGVGCGVSAIIVAGMGTLFFLACLLVLRMAGGG